MQKIFVEGTRYSIAPEPIDGMIPHVPTEGQVFYHSWDIWKGDEWICRVNATKDVSGREMARQRAVIWEENLKRAGK